VTKSITGMTIAGLVLAVAIGCSATEASAQLRAFVTGGQGGQQAPGSAGLGTAGLGVGGFGSATENLNGPDAGTAGIGSGSGLGLPLLGGADNALGVTGNAGVSQGSLSSAIDRPSSPIDSVTNSLMGSVRNAVSRPTNSATNPAGKPKQNANAGATSSSGPSAAVASKAGPAKNP
jgi:hypothetical protein